MPRNVSSPLLEASASSRRTRRRSFVVIIVLGIIVLVGLLLIGGRPHLPKSASIEQGAGGTGKTNIAEDSMTDYHMFLVKDDFKGKKLSPQQLNSLVGMYYAAEPKAAELKALFDAGEKVLFAVGGKCRPSKSLLH